MPIVLAALLTTLLLLGFPCHHALAADSLTTAVSGLPLSEAFKMMRGSLDKMMSDAEARGDYLLARALQNAKDALDKWQETNTALLNDASKKFEGASFENFNRVTKAIDDFHSGVRNNLTTAQDISFNANQIVENLPLAKKQTYILKFTPRVLPPKKGSIQLRITGVNLDQGNPQLSLKDGLAIRALPGPTEAEFTIPEGEITPKPETLQRHIFKITHTRRAEPFFKSLFNVREPVTRELSVIVLPSSLGSYTMTYNRNVAGTEEVQWTGTTGRFVGTNTSQKKLVPPSPANDGKGPWRWRVGSVSMQPGAGEAGHCAAIVFNESSENGIVVEARLDEIKNIKYPKGTDGHVDDCFVTGTLWRPTSTITPGITKSGTLNWTDAVPISHEDDTINNTILLTIKTNVENQSLIHQGDASHKFYEAKHSPTGFVVTPKIPADLIDPAF